MQRLAEGDKNAFRELYRRYAGQVFGYSRRLLRNVSAAEDNAQEVWVKVVRAATSYRSEGTLKSWLYMVTRRTALNLLRRRAEQETSLEEVIEEPIDWSRSEFEERILARAEGESLRRRIDELPTHQRVALTLWMTENLSYEDIAGEMGLNESSVKSLLHRVRTRLEKALMGGGA